MEASFKSLSPALKEIDRQHALLVRSIPLKESLKPSSETLTRIRDFRNQVKAAGAGLEDEADRRAAQNVLDYWTGELLRGQDPQDLGCEEDAIAPYGAEASPLPASDSFGSIPILEPSVAPPEGETGKGASTATLPGDIVGATRQQRSEQVRIAAVARQWRNSGRQSGYLLEGKALEQAKRFRGTDRDIDALVSASEKRVVLRLNRMRIVLVGVCIASVALAMVFAGLWWNAEQERRTAEEQRQIADQEAVVADQEAKLAADVRAAAYRWLAQLEEAQERLDLANAALTRAWREGQISMESLPPALRASLGPATSAAHEVQVWAQEGSGLVPNFLGTDLPFPRLADSAKATQRLNYRNYSVLFSASDKLALVSVSMHDRQTRRILPWLGVAPFADTRIPPTDQLDPNVGSAEGLELGRLVSRHEVAWGENFDSVAYSEAAQKAAAAVSVLPNLTPQWTRFSRGAWLELERWLLASHNPTAGRIQIYSGPVLSGTDGPEGRRIPTSFWKIAVSLSAPGRLVVDAFLIPQSREDGTSAGEIRFREAEHRVSVRDIETLTGLDLGRQLREAGSAILAAAPPPDTREGALPDDLTKLTANTPEERKEAAQRLVDIVRNEKLPEADRIKVVQGLVKMGQDASMSQLTPTGRLNLLVVLSAVPASSWNLEKWSSLKGLARRLAADLEVKAQGSPDFVGPDTRRYLESLKSRLDWEVPRQYSVSLTFAGMTREAAQEMRGKMASLGWKLNKEVRTSNAAGRNEVRYPEKGAAGAAALATLDMRAAGWASVQQPVLDVTVPFDSLNISVSK